MALFTNAYTSHLVSLSSYKTYINMQNYSLTTDTGNVCMVSTGYDTSIRNILLNAYTIYIATGY